MIAADLRPGDWIIAPFGHGALMFYVVAQQELKKAVEVGCLYWPAGSTTSLLYFMLAERGFMFIGRGEPRCFRLPWMHPYRRPALS